MPRPALSSFVLGSYGQDILCVIKEYNTTTGALDAVDITSATNLKIIFRTPLNQKIVKTATLVSGPLGKMKYVTVDGFFDKRDRSLVGVWRFRPRFDLGAFVTTDDYGASGEWAQFRVVD